MNHSTPAIGTEQYREAEAILRFRRRNTDPGVLREEGPSTLDGKPCGAASRETRRSSHLPPVPPPATPRPPAPAGESVFRSDANRNNATTVDGDRSCEGAQQSTPAIVSLFGGNQS